MSNNNEAYINKTLQSVDPDLKRLEALRKKKSESKDALNKNIRRILLYTGFIGASISAVSYIIATIVMIIGFSANLSMENQILFSVLGVVVGMSISFMLRSQGVIYAKQNQEVKEIEKSFKNEKNKNKKEKQLHEITYYMFWATVKEFFIKATTTGLIIYFTLRVFVEGSGDWGLMWLAFSNLLMFTSFGLIGLSKMYDRYIDEHIPAIVAKIKLLKEKEKQEKEKQEKEQKKSTLN